MVVSLNATKVKVDAVPVQRVLSKILVSVFFEKVFDLTRSMITLFASVRGLFN